MRTPSEHDYLIATDLIKNLFEYGFDKFYTEEEYYDWKYNMGHEFEKDFEVLLFDGATKMVIVPNVALKTQFPWVIKVNLPNTRMDYCSIESMNYYLAKIERLADLFASIYEFKTINECTFYLQEYVDIDEELISSSFYDYYTDGGVSEDEVYDYICEMNDWERIAAVFNDIGLEKLQQLQEFCSNLQINDLHEGNYGVNSLGKIVLMDYSGY